MPDIKTALEAALSKTANAWAADDEAHQHLDPQKDTATPALPKNKATRFSTTNNVSRITFELIRDNPGILRQEVRDRLGRQGFKDTSVTSLVSQMLRCGHIRFVGESLFAVNKTYTPINLTQLKKIREVRVVKRAAPVNKPVAQKANTPAPTEPALPRGLAALAAPEPDRVVLRKVMSAADVLNSLSVSEAFKLYQDLAKMFGGK